MRMFLLFVLLFIPVTSLANVNPEVCFNIGNDETLCNSIAGCVYDAEFNGENKCRQCPQSKYCPATETEAQSCPDDFSTSELGATSAEECFKPDPITCEKPDGTPDTSCRHYNTNTNPYRCFINGIWGNAHMEEDDNCYYNIRFCWAFQNITGCDGDDRIFNDSNSTTPLARWTSSKWDVSGCKCQEGGFTDNNNRYYCTGKHFNVKPRPNTGQYTLLDNVNTAIVYDIYTNDSSYHCQSCQNGYYVSNIYQSSNPADSPYCKKPGSASIVVCNCEEIPKGWYGTENCSWNADTLTSNPCPKNWCPAGKTTDGPGATSDQQCKYTHDTQFCDAKGCFSFTEEQLVEWRLNNP